MKKTIRLLVLVALLCSSVEPAFSQLIAHLHRQNHPVVITKPSFKTLKDILQEFKSHYKVDILYFDHLVEGYKISADAVVLDPNVEQSLGNLLKPLGLRYKRTGNGGYVIIKKTSQEKVEKKSASLDESTSLISEPQLVDYRNGLSLAKINRVIEKPLVVEKVVSGRITESAKGEGLPGVNILIKGSTTGVVTDVEGNYKINIPDGPVSLVFSFVGYISQEIKIGSESVLDVVLLTDTRALEELVVVGYGTQKKINLTGAVANVGAEVIESRPVANLGQALQGTVSNLNITQSSGALGTGATFNIRGNTSINGGGPLILVNNIPMDVNLISPNDIETVTVLKDAASAAIYGARAAYGVVLITTKSGKKSMKPVVNVSMNYSTNRPVVKFETMDAMERMTYMNTANIKANGRPYYQFDEFYEKAITAHYNDPSQPETFQHPNESPSVYAFSANTDWPRLLLRDSYPMQQYNASVSGGNDKFDYYTSLAYFKAKGIPKNFDEKYTRYNIMANLNYSITKWMKVGTKISVNTSKKMYPPNDRTNNFDENRNMFQVHSWANWPAYLPDGNYASIGSVPNVLQMHKEGGYRSRDILDSWLTGLVKLTPIKNMTINLDYSVNMNDTKELDYRKQLPMYDRQGQSGFYPYTNPSSVTRSAYSNRYHVLNAYADYENTFKSKHYVKMMVGFNQENANYGYFAASKEKLIVNSMPYMNLAYGERYAYDSESEYSIRGAFSRLNYSYDDRYLIEFNGRYDGSSKFPKKDRFAFFPSVSVGWRMDNEGFFESLRNTVNMLKIRASYGSLGNQNLDPARYGYYPYIANYTAGLSGYLLNGENPMSVYAPGLVSSSLTWETVTQQDLGLDFSILGNKLSGSFDMYRRDTKNMLTKSQTLPALLAVNEPQANAANMKTTGFDFTIGWNHNVNKVKYGITLLLSDYSAKITKFSNPSGIISDKYVGRKEGEIWGLETGGIFQTDEEALKLDQTQISGRKREAGDLFFVDQNGDGKITRGKQTLSDHGDMKIIGNNTPRFSYGFRSNLSWKGFDVDLFFQGVAKRDMVISANYFVGQYNDEWGVQGKVGTDWWSPENRDAYFPRPLITGGSDVTTTQTRYLQNAAYLRLKQLTVSYTIPTVITEKIGSRRIQVYFSGNNMWETTKMIRISDPEQASAMAYPLNRAFSIGANLGF
ncbi:TonB-dependent receptor [Dyadobacter sp. LHD-138]|uniref:SusC/RagA family TonB-linked outer membrane protein n=1 Tax=Dyadobacter sp. LHD-138 TaxID=3071413 RepID=UPI0027DF6AD3|nr:TonB-dependent receptor [Dyadobacter sp. LHD-138]MDQ6477170.1 TonB-dependent receptor [Dyadobacter sp. LHD-138]